jgi:hypothetical protein
MFRRAAQDQVGLADRSDEHRCSAVPHVGGAAVGQHGIVGGDPVTGIEEGASGFLTARDSRMALSISTRARCLVRGAASAKPIPAPTGPTLTFSSRTRFNVDSSRAWLSASSFRAEM